MRRSIFDINLARKETPECERTLHFNNAGAALMSKKVLDTIINFPYMESETGNTIRSCLSVPVFWGHDEVQFTLAGRKQSSDYMARTIRLENRLRSTLFGRLFL